MRCTNVGWKESGSRWGARHITRGQDKGLMHRAWPCKGALSSQLENYPLLDRARAAGQDVERFSMKYVK